MKKILLSLCVLAMTYAAHAQIPYSLVGTSYMQDFDAIGSGLPIGWRVDSLTNKNIGLGNNAQNRFSATAVTWTSSSRGFKNVASADGLIATSTTTDQGNSTDRALGCRQVGVSGWDKKDSLVAMDFNIASTTGLTSFNLQFKFMSVHTGAKRYNNWIVQYGIGANPTAFTTVATTPVTITADSNFTNTTVNVNFGSALNNISQPVWIRVLPNDTTQGSGTRPLVALDDFNLTWTGSGAGNPKPLIASLSPADNSTNVALGSNLVINFDKNITVGSGSINIHNITDLTTQVITLPSASVTTSGMAATITGVTLVNAKSYSVDFDSTAFMAGTNNSYGIYDATTWNFTTTSGIIPPATTLNESFVGCNAPLLGSFTESSVIGTQTWRCSNFGHSDTDAVYMNGFASGASNDNEDWLISPPLNMSGMTQPMLNYWTKKRFIGTDTKQLYISNDYINDVTAATWTLLQDVSTVLLDTNIWYNATNINLTAYKAFPFTLAYKYVSAASGSSDEWTIDDVMIIDGAASTKNMDASNLNLHVYGTAVDGNLLLGIESKSANNFHIAIIDLLGNKIMETNTTVQTGKNKVRVQMPSVSNGIYFVQVWNAESKGVLKFNKQ